MENLKNFEVDQGNNWPEDAPRRLMNHKFQANENVAAGDQINENSSPFELRAAPVSGLSPAVLQCTSQAEYWGVLSFVLKNASLATSVFLGFWTRTKQNDVETISEINPGEQIKIDIPNQVSLPVCWSHKISTQALDTSSYLGGLFPKQTNEGQENVAVITCGEQVVVDIPYSTSLLASSLDMNPQELNSSSSSYGPSQISTDKVEPNGNVAVRDQTNGDISDTAILHQPRIESPDTSNSHIEHPNNSSSEAPQNTFRIANDDSETTSQPVEQPTPAAVVAVSQAQVPNQKTAAKVAFWVISISGGGIVSVLAGLIGDKQTDLTHKVLFKAYTLLNYISLVSAIGLFFLTLKPPSSPRLVIIIKTTMWITLGSITYAISCATSIILAKTLDEVVIILVGPPVVVFVLIVLTF